MEQFSWTRRDFIKTATLAGGTALMAAATSMLGDEAAAYDKAQDRSGQGTDITLHGVSDIHVHAAPDTKGRSINELSFAREAQKAGYRAVMYKSNEWSCHDRAYLVREALPGFECFGSLCMNRAHGDKVNVYAAEMALKTTGGFCRCIWMPTLAAAYQHKHDKLPGPGIAVLSDTGKVLPEVVRVMELCAEWNIIFATGHASPDESIVMARKAREVGVKKFVVTHANSHMWKMTREQILTVADLDGWIEYSYITNLWGPGTGVPMHPRMSDAEFAGFAKILPERSFITTDLGQLNMPHPLEGMKKCIFALRESGMTQKDIDLMVRSNPAMLVGVAAS